MFTIECQHKDKKEIHKAVFDNIEDARLWWDSIVYLHSVYQFPLTPRP